MIELPEGGVTAHTCKLSPKTYFRYCMIIGADQLLRNDVSLYETDVPRKSSSGSALMDFQDLETTATDLKSTETHHLHFCQYRFTTGQEETCYFKEL